MCGTGTFVLLRTTVCYVLACKFVSLGTSRGRVGEIQSGGINVILKSDQNGKKYFATTHWRETLKREKHFCSTIKKIKFKIKISNQRQQFYQNQIFWKNFFNKTKKKNLFWVKHRNSIEKNNILNLAIIMQFCTTTSQFHLRISPSYLYEWVVWLIHTHTKKIYWMQIETKTRI